MTFVGDFKSWNDAELVSGGYATGVILARTKHALLQVKNGLAIYERDSVLFDEILLPFPLLSGLLAAALASQGNLSVLDFGGSLGSTYFQCRHFLAPIERLRWSVVEQPAHVACGQSEFATEELRFYTTIEKCLEVETPNVLVLSSVLQYLAEPYRFLETALSYKFPFVLIDRTAFLRGGGDRLTVEHVPESIYPASYPAWFLSEAKFLSTLEAQYSLIASFRALDTTDPENGKADYKGFIFKRRP